MAFLHLLISLIVAMIANSKEDIPELRRWCFYTNWAQYRRGEAAFLPEDIDPTLCTHISYAFAKISNNELHPYEWNDENSTYSQGMYSKVNKLKENNPSLKTLLAVGGWNMGSHQFSDVVSRSYIREDFIKQSVQFLRTNGFDGLDLCWLYPTKRAGSSDEDKIQFGYLLEELKTAFKEDAVKTKKKELLLGMVVGSEKTLIDEAYDIVAINKSVDVISILSYDFYNADSSNYAMHPSALYPGNFTTGADSEKNVKFTAEYWNSLGIPKEKINIGISFFGRSFYFGNSDDSRVEGIPSLNKGHRGTSTRTDGFLAYYEICTLLEHGSESVFMTDRGVPFTVIDNEWIGYENIQSVQLKADFALQNNYGGVMLWSLDLDDFNGECPGGEKYPLLKAINRVAEGDYNATETSSM